ncbi:EDD domain protein, DegV family [Anaerobranca californiensis DSM 14826]|jgi:fatty acid-binding protein DegV|uniref:EDD domain protein, DegV family n=1 Tax=Anaerobranca californiensis DSM 14826 TaxID=1120989 RepID=A0A1M6KPE2_9FIRM|nr:DegV family protein [Anaerobranca californiensis]SHJ60829.1 EDD domain protein, DegV family [Anaerobranca californiensis DSM 14826]
MKKVAIVTDSSADLPQSLIEELNIHVIPMKIQISANTYKEGIDISFEEVYRKFREGCQEITVNQPSPAEFMELYRELSREYSEIISIHLSSKINGTVSSADIAKKMLGDLVDITIIDSGLVSMGLGVLVLEVARAAKALESKEQLLLLANEIKDSIKGFLLTEGEYKSLFLPPMNTDEDPNIYNIFLFNSQGFKFLEGHRNKAKSLQDFVNVICSQVDNQLKYKIAIIHSDNLEDAVKLKDLIEDNIKYHHLIFSELSSISAINLGLGAIGLVLYPL